MDVVVAFFEGVGVDDAAVERDVGDLGGDDIFF